MTPYNQAQSGISLPSIRANEVRSINIKERMIKYFVVLSLLLLIANYFLHTLGSKSYMPVALFLFALVINLFKVHLDMMLILMLTYSTAIFAYFVPSFGTLAPYVFTICMVFRRQGFPNSPHAAGLLVQIAVFVFLNVLGMMLLNPISPIAQVFSVFNLLIAMAVFFVSSNNRYSHDDLKLLINSIAIITIYLALASMNAFLGIIKTNSPLLVITYPDYIGHIGVAVFSAGSWDYFVSLAPFFLILLLGDRNSLFNLNKAMLFIAYLFSVIGAALIFSKTKTVIIVGTTALILIVYLSTVRIKRYFYSLSLIALVIGLLLLANQFFNLSYVFERFQQQPEIFKAVLENPTVAEGTTRDDAFYWGMRRNTQRNWILGYGWDTWNANYNSYFHEAEIPHARADYHNLYFSIFPLFGWLGGAIFLYWLFSFVFKSFTLMRRAIHIRSRLLGTAFFMLSIALLLSGYSSTFTSAPSFIFILFIWMGVLNSIYAYDVHRHRL